VQVMTAHLTKPIPIATEFNSSIPKQCDQIVARAMAKRASDRYQNVAEMAAELWELARRHQQISHDGLPGEDDDKSRPLNTALIVEVSKMQAALLNDAVSRAGAEHVSLYQTSEAASRAVEQSRPDLLVTAMQLPDGSGLELVLSLANRSLLNRTT